MYKEKNLKPAAIRPAPPHFPIIKYIGMSEASKKQIKIKLNLSLQIPQKSMDCKSSNKATYSEKFFYIFLKIKYIKGNITAVSKNQRCR